MIENFVLKAEGITKYFNRGVFIFKNIDLTIKNKSAIALTGYNGSGKSTFLKIAAGVLRPSGGKLTFEIENKNTDTTHLYKHISYVAPYLNLYEEFTALEHLEVMSNIRNSTYSKDDALAILERLNILKSANQPINTFSSGMKQRVKFALALLNNPDILFLDEPGTNLDNEGLTTVKELIVDHIASGGAAVIASNDKRETDFCESELNISNFKK